MFSRDELEEELNRQLQDVSLDDDSDDEEMSEDWYASLRRNRDSIWNSLETDEFNYDDYWQSSEVWKKFKQSHEDTNSTLESVRHSIQDTQEEIAKFVLETAVQLAPPDKTTTDLKLVLYCDQHCIPSCPAPCPIHCSSDCTFFESVRENNSKQMLQLANEKVAQLNVNALVKEIDEEELEKIDRIRQQEKDRDDKLAMEFEKRTLELNKTLKEAEDRKKDRMKQLELEEEAREVVRVELERKRQIEIENKKKEIQKREEQQKKEFERLQEALRLEEIKEREQLRIAQSREQERQRLIEFTLQMMDEDQLSAAEEERYRVELDRLAQIDREAAEELERQRIQEQERERERLEAIENQIRLERFTAMAQIWHRLVRIKYKNYRLQRRKQTRIEYTEELERQQQIEREKQRQERGLMHVEEMREKKRLIVLQVEEEERKDLLEKLAREEELERQRREEERIVQEKRREAAERHGLQQEELRQRQRRRMEEEERQRCLQELKKKQCRAIEQIVARISLRLLMDRKFSQWRAFSDCILAAVKIQSTWRRFKSQSEKTLQAASIVQSVFRGFHVRRKINAALQLAKYVEEDDDFEYEEIDVDNFMDQPPEIHDDWGKPNLPESRPESTGNALSPVEPVDNVRQGGWDRRPRQQQQQEQQQQPQQHEEEEEAESDNELQSSENNQSIEEPPTTSRKEQSKEELAQEWGMSGGKLAELLWKRRRKEKARKMAPKKREQLADPTYRVKMLKQTSKQRVNQKTSAPAASKTETQVSWTIGGGKKKNHKAVKVPSLVERLRGKVAGYRNAS